MSRRYRVACAAVPTAGSSWSRRWPARPGCGLRRVCGGTRWAAGGRADASGCFSLAEKPWRCPRKQITKERRPANGQEQIRQKIIGDHMADRLIRGVHAAVAVQVCAVECTGLVERARQIHGTLPSGHGGPGAHAWPRLLHDGQHAQKRRRVADHPGAGRRPAGRHHRCGRRPREYPGLLAKSALYRCLCGPMASWMSGAALAGKACSR